MNMAKRWDRITIILLVVLIALGCMKLFTHVDSTNVTGTSGDATALTYKVEKEDKSVSADELFE